MKVRILNMPLKNESDVVAVRRYTRQVAQRLGFDLPHHQSRLAAAVSEVARNAVNHGGGGSVTFSLGGDKAPQSLFVEIGDRGPGIQHPQAMLEGSDRDTGRTGLGIAGVRRLMDDVQIETSSSGTRVLLIRRLPRNAPLLDQPFLAALSAELQVIAPTPESIVLSELHQQNAELIQTMDELERKQDELSRLNAELFDTNQGVLALYSELEEKAENLRRADNLKTRFLSNMSHEFRTPLNSIIALSRLLLDRVDGSLTAEQEKQIGYVKKSALDLLELVNDLLDLAKVEAGHVVVKPVEFSIDNLFAALRGMLRPLLSSARVNLVFEPAGGIPLLFGDEAKVSQILRNFLSNALKFTEQGEVRVSAQYVQAGSGLAELNAPPAEDSVILCVADTGIGIANEDTERIFEEFTQVDTPLQGRARGTGLGLPLCRKLAAVLGGEVWMQSVFGLGSRFYLRIPRLTRPVDISTESGTFLQMTAPASGLKLEMESPGHKRQLV